MDILCQIVIPKFITKVKISNKRRAKYYNRYKGKGVSKKVPKKLTTSNYAYNKHGWLVDKSTKKRVIANPNVAGKPKYEVLSGNKIISGYGSPHIRKTIVTSLRDFYRPFIITYLDRYGSLPSEAYPLKIEWDVHTSTEKTNWDASNLSFYYKYFEDALCEGFEYKDGAYVPSDSENAISIVPDDNIEFITHPPGPRIIPVDKWEDRKFVFRLYHDNRNLNYPPWNKKPK